MSKSLKKLERKGYIVKESPYKYVVCFKKARKFERCFRYSDTGTRRRPSLIKDPNNWVEDVKPVSQPKGAYKFSLYQEPYLWNAMMALEAKLKAER